MGRIDTCGGTIRATRITQEDDVLEREADKDQGVGGQDRQDHLDGGADRGDDEAVQEEPAERHRGHGRAVVIAGSGLAAGS